MKYQLSLLVLAFAILIKCTDPTWSYIPSLRAGQVECVTSLMTSEDTSPTITDTSFNYYQSITGSTDVTQLRYGISLISYESWMTDTFSFNISMVNCTYTGAKIRFQVLDNTFFTKVKVHYIVIWALSPNIGTGASALYNMEIIYGCYLTSDLLNPTNRTQTVGGLQSSTIASGLIALSKPLDDLVMKSMITGMQLKNSVGNNDYVKITPSFRAATALLDYRVQVEANNYLTFFCVSTVIVNPNVHKIAYFYNIEYKTYILTSTNAGLTGVPYSLRYDGSDRMFFGISEFNLSMSDTRYLNVETANISLVSQLYANNSAMNQITYNTFFFARRSCANPTYYDPINYTCVATSASCVNSQAYAAGLVCKPCHYSCSGCTLGDSKTSCSGCSSSLFRKTLNVAFSCLCQDSYVDVGVSICQPCNKTLIGCKICTDSNTCTLCDHSTYTESSGKCVCYSNYFMASGYCLTYPGCLTATYFNNIVACQTCNEGNNFVRVETNYTCNCNSGYFYNSTTVICQDRCGDNITAYGKCDDGNKISGDGCDSNCNIENGYHCSYNKSSLGVPGLSVCVLKQDITITYLYAQRYVDSNSFKMAFSIYPLQSGLTTTSFDKNFNSTLPIASQKITCDPTNSIVFVEGEYTQDLEGTYQTATISFDNLTFYADTQTINFKAVGINAELVFDQFTSSNLILGYIVMGEAFLALILAIFASVVGLKLVGIELLIPIQLIYFTLATIPQQRTYNYVLSYFRYANGFNTIVPYSYSRTYSQNKSLVAMNYQTQFLLSTNIMLGVFVIILFWLLIHHFRLKYKEYKLQQFLQSNALIESPQQNSVDSQEDKDDVEQDEQQMKLKKKKKSSNQNSDLEKEESKLREDHHRSFKVFTFQVDRTYFIFYLILINQMMFGFIIMTLNVPILIFSFPEEINVLVCNFIFFIFIGNIVFISYDQESNKMIAFTCIKDRYAYIYILIDFIIITALSMTFQEAFSTYLVCALTISFTILVIKEKPYSNVLLSLQNLIALYLQIMLVLCEVILCLINSSANEKTSLIYTFLIMGLIAVGQILTIIRIVVKVNFKKAFDDLKNPHKDDENDKKFKKVIEKNLDLLEEDHNVSIIPPESVKNGLFAPKDKMIDWESKNTEEYESIRQRQMEDEENHPIDHEEEGSQNKQEKLNELEILKKRLRSNLKIKKEQEMLQKKGI